MYHNSKQKRNKIDKFVLQYMTDMYKNLPPHVRGEYDESVAGLLKEVQLILNKHS